MEPHAPRRCEVGRPVTCWGRKMQMEFVVDSSTYILAEYLIAEGIHDDVVTKIHDNRVTCSLFLDLTEEDLKDLASVIGDRIALRRTMEKARKVIELIYS